jgi:hypothetical protein
MAVYGCVAAVRRASGRLRRGRFAVCPSRSCRIADVRRYSRRASTTTVILAKAGARARIYVSRWADSRRFRFSSRTTRITKYNQRPIAPSRAIQDRTTINVRPEAGFHCQSTLEAIVRTMARTLSQMTRFLWSIRTCFPPGASWSDTKAQATQEYGEDALDISGAAGTTDRCGIRSFRRWRRFGPR